MGQGESHIKMMKFNTCLHCERERAGRIVCGGGEANETSTGGSGDNSTTTLGKLL